MATFRSRPDGSKYPISRRQTLTPDFSGQRKAWDKKRLSMMKTLQNPLLFKNFAKKLEKLNPERDIDVEIIDRTLEPEEAAEDIKRKHPDIRVEESKDNFKAEWREDLDSRGIDNIKVQNLIASDPDPLSEKEIEEVAGALQTRSNHAIEVDKAMKAPLTKDVRRWAKTPNRVDIQTVDDKQKH